VPPSCGAVPLSNLHPVEPPGSEADPAGAATPPPTPVPGTDAAPTTAAAPLDELETFEWFLTRVANTVHSATARTLPATDASDLYPVDLARETLPPGTVFADPYGHTLVVVSWIPQGADATGVLLAADAQPDGTVGRRRFWRGTFLFTPDAADVGPGFKAFRPARWDRAAGAVVVATNAELATTDEHPRWSERQYVGSSDDFYDAVEALINPRPLDPDEALVALVDALEEAAVRRVVSVDNGADWTATHPETTIEMPEGHDVFETEGPWEDYATPSRDMRLLIAVDTVRTFPDAVTRRPELYGVPAAELDGVAAGLRARLDVELAGRSFRYRRSDGSPWTLTLADLVERAEGFEVAYNPNDCVEVRWAAPEGSDERSTCARRAPAAQLALMEAYRAWFRARSRPPR
jgi:hypothetical protein